MVKFMLKERTDDRYIYEYVPEGDYSKRVGKIIVDLHTETVFVEEVAESDFKCRATVDELNEMRESVNKMRTENGEPPLTEEEWPLAEEASTWYYYANHAIKKLCDLFNCGEEPTEGLAAWY